jgi:hypothetical protein
MSSLGKSFQTMSNTCKIYQREIFRWNPGEILWIQTENDLVTDHLLSDGLITECEHR